MRAMIRALRRDDEGSALMTVLGTILICSVLAVTVMASSLSVISTTATARSSVQARAAAEAGVAEAMSVLRKGECDDGLIESATGTTPSYRAEVWFEGAFGCPTGSGELLVRSVGYSEDATISGLGTEVTLEAVFEVETSFGTGSAIFIATPSAFNSFTVTVVDEDVSGDIVVADGDLRCTSASTVNGEIIVSNGTIDMTNTCTVTGDVMAYGSVNFTSNVQVGGDVVSQTGSVTTTNDSTHIGGSVWAATTVNLRAIIDGSVYAAGQGGGTSTVQEVVTVGGSLLVGNNLKLRGRVLGNVSVTGNADLDNYVWIGGDLKVGGNITQLVTNSAPTNGHVHGTVTVTGNFTGFSNNAKIHGTVTVGGSYGGASNGAQALSGVTANVTPAPTAPSAPGTRTLPPAPAWQDWRFVHDDWIEAGFTNPIITANCSSHGFGVYGVTEATVGSFPYLFAQTTGPQIYDARACSGEMGLGWNGASIQVRSDIVILAKSFNVGNARSWVSADGQPHKLWILVEDTTENAAPNCPLGAVTTTSINIGSTQTIDPKLSIMLYTPCKVVLGGTTTWRGQIYAAGLEVWSNESLAYTPVGIPGTDFGNAGGANAAELSDIQFVRRVTD